jgi:hypothetical protein
VPGILVNVEGIEGAAEAGLEVAQQRVDSAELRQVAGFVRRRLGRRVRATTLAGLRTRQQGSDSGMEPCDARPSVVADQGAVHGKTGQWAQPAGCG